MNNKELIAQEHNLEATIAQLKAEADELAGQLSSLLLMKSNIDEEVKGAEAFIEQAKGRAEEQMHDVNRAKEELAAQRASLTLEFETRQRKLNTLAEHEKDANRTLSKLNSWILTAEDEKRVLERDFERLNKALEHKDTILAQVSALAERTIALQSEIIGLQASRDTLEAGITRLKEQAEADLKAVDSKREAAAVEAGTWLQKRNEAENEFIRFNDECEKKREDLGIIVSRIEEKWNQTFPELKFPL